MSPTEGLRDRRGGCWNIPAGARGVRGAGGAVLAEGVGAGLLVLLGCLPSLSVSSDPFTTALASGLIVALLVQCLDHISGSHFNPAVTLCGMLRGRVTPTLGALYVSAQCAGAAGGALMLRTLAHPDRLVTTPALCTTTPAPHVTPLQAVVVEGLLGLALALANCASWDPRNQLYRDSWPLRIGLSVSGLCLVASELTGASMNPARSLGPALCANSWVQHWVYWAGPLSGALLGATLYSRVWAAPPSPGRAADDALTLAGKLSPPTPVDV